MIRSGLLGRIKESLDASGVTYVELGGVVPNPRLSLVRKGIELCRKEGVDFLLAVGGGSVIDSAKAIGYGLANDGDVWDFYCGKATAQKSLPTIGISTIAASGSEFSEFAVLTNRETLEKNGTAASCLRLDALIEDPSYTCGVNAYHTAAGVADTMSHVMEG